MANRSEREMSLVFNQGQPLASNDCAFQNIVQNNESFVDKSLIIRDFVKRRSKLLITRPRRFGKSFNLSLLQ